MGDISECLRIAGFHRTWKQCKDKMKNLKQYYKDLKDGHNRSGNDRSNWPYYDLIDSVLADRPSTRPRHVIDTTSPPTSQYPATMSTATIESDSSTPASTSHSPTSTITLTSTPTVTTPTSAQSEEHSAGGHHSPDLFDTAISPPPTPGVQDLLDIQPDGIPTDDPTEEPISSVAGQTRPPNSQTASTATQCCRKSSEWSHAEMLRPSDRS